MRFKERKKEENMITFKDAIELCWDVYKYVSKVIGIIGMMLFLSADSESMAALAMWIGLSILIFVSSDIIRYITEYFMDVHTTMRYVRHKRAVKNQIERKAFMKSLRSI